VTGEQVVTEEVSAVRALSRGRHRRPAGSAQTARARPVRPAVGRAVTVLVGLAAGAVLLAVSGADAASPRAPVAHVRLPGNAEGLAPYVPQASCDPVAKPGVEAFRNLMLSTYRRGSDGGIVRACSDGGPSEHKEGRAWDWMLDVHDTADVIVADAAIRWLLAPGPHGELAWNARRVGVMYIIWDGRIWASYRADEGWRTYVGASEHTDHIHFSFSWAGAMGRTSWWTGRVAPTDYGPCPTVAGQLAPRYTRPRYVPCPAPAPAPVAPYAKPGDRGPRVLALQRALHVTPVSGWYGPVTRRTVAAYQAHYHVAATGVTDERMAASMHLPGAVAPPPPPARPVPPYAKPGDRGPRVLAIQAALGVRPLSGWYGPVTTRTVTAFQRAHRLRPTGVVDVTTARAMRMRGV
jgi:Putative peptidoglycan binding domain